MRANPGKRVKGTAKQSCVEIVIYNPTRVTFESTNSVCCQEYLNPYLLFNSHPNKVSQETSVSGWLEG